MIEYPAAHSMDTGWFCVDEDGHIAHFSTGEDGPLYTEAPGEEAIHTALRAIADTLPVSETAPDDDPPYFDEDIYERPSVFGLYSYGYGGWGSLIEPYTRGEGPSEPLTLDKLPADLQKKLGEGRLHGVCFERDEAIQFVEHGDLMPWGEAAAWLSSDGKHVRPMPGSEQAYANYHAERHKEGAPDDDYTYETPTVPPRVSPLLPGGAQASRIGGAGWSVFWLMVAIGAGIGLALWLGKGAG